MSTQPHANGSYPAGYGLPELPLPPVHVEAPVSANCRIMIEGHEIQVTVRSGASPGEVETVMGTMVGLLRAYGSQAPAGPPVSQPQPEPPPLPPAAPPQAPAGSDAVPYCFEHGQHYKRHAKDGQIWYSHKIQNPVPGGSTWCRYQPPTQA